MKENKLTKQQGGIDRKKHYIVPQLTTHFIEISQSILEQSITKSVNQAGMKEQWDEETIEETFTWTW